MKKSIPKSDLTVEVQDSTNNKILEFSVPYNAKMSTINKILWNNKIFISSNKDKIIGF